MEVLSGVASSIAVASLAIQLLQSVGTIKSFIHEVKGASKELERLAALLDQLNALLADVRDVMERQTSLQGQHFPAPSQMIFDALKSCEGSLGSLQIVIQKYKKTRHSNASTVLKLKDDIKFSFKAKDIAGFETQIQREIDTLHAALGLNSTRILMATIPVLLQNQQTCTTIVSSSHAKHDLAHTLASSVVKQEPPLLDDFSHFTTPVSQCWTSTTLEWLGIYQRGSVQYLRHDTSRRHRSKYTMENAVSESYEVLVAWRFLRLGLHWDRKYPYGSFGLYPSTYPVVDFDQMEQYRNLIERNSVDDIQQAISSGALHPYVRDEEGESLLHVAAQNRRADVCRLLMQYGLRPDVSHYHWSPLSLCVSGYNSYPKADAAETIRLLLYSCNQYEDLGDLDFLFKICFGVFHISLEIMEWMWMNAAAVLDDQELASFRFLLLAGLVTHYGRIDGSSYDNKITETILKLMDNQMAQHYVRSEVGLLQALFWPRPPSFDSQILGASFVNLLTCLGLDVEACISRELELLNGGMLEDGDRKVVFEPVDRGWLLRWTWDHDPSGSGYLLVSQYTELCADAPWVEHLAENWPFFSDDFGHDSKARESSWTKAEVRSTRRLANKARKERARTGQKRQRSKMPGAWDW